MDTRASTTHQAAEHPAASSKTTGKSFMLSAEEREAIELRDLEQSRQDLIAAGVIKPEAKA